MCREKGLRDVIASIPLVSDADFVFAGEWPSHKDKQEVCEFLKKHGVEDRVIFAGVVTGRAKYELFVSCDIFVLPTYFVYEGHTVSSVEALAAGLPIICTDHGALNESVQHGWNGYFVPSASPEVIAYYLNNLVRDDQLRAKMGKRSRELYEKKFTIERFIENWCQGIEFCFNKDGR
jgi:glycosyltransferase involved in cell wall biosynthesis